LVKDVKGVLPLSPKRHHRVVLVQEPTAARAHFFAQPPLQLGQLLAEQGFEVRAYDPASPPNAGNADAVIFVLAQESLMTRSNIYLDWAELLGPAEQAMQRFWHELPTVLVSFGHPYYLYDAPRMPCVINAYTATEPVQRAVVRKLLGLEAFTGTSPVDARCGLEDAAY
jgi:beta-N-acetylhexosaminidase